MNLDLARLPGVQDVRAADDRVSVAFPEADFTISLSARPDRACETQWEVIVREARPGLNTWWGKWHRSFAVPRSEVGPLIADELGEAIERVRGMLEDHARTSREISF